MKAIDFINLLSFNKNPEIISFYSQNRLSRNLARDFARPINGKEASKWKDKFSEKTHSVFFFGNPELWFLFEIVKKYALNYFFADKAYFDRSNYYRITKNALELTNFLDLDSKRFEDLKIQILPRRQGKKILICPQSEIFFRLNGLTREDWLLQTISEIRNYTDRPIEIRYKEKQNTETAFYDALVDVHAVVVFTSMAGVQSVLNGVPSFTTHEGVAKHFSSGSLSNLESPFIPDNVYEMACALANNQWTLDEIKSGLPHKHFGMKILNNHN
jgi:hypothetical protein